MSRHQGTRISRTMGNASGAIEKAAVGLFRWAATDHSGTGKVLAHMPQMGFIDELRTIFLHFLISVAGAVLMGIWVFTLIAYVAPQLFNWLFSLA